MIGNQTLNPDNLRYIPDEPTATDITTAKIHEQKAKELLDDLENFSKDTGEKTILSLTGLRGSGKTRTILILEEKIKKEHQDAIVIKYEADRHTGELVHRAFLETSIEEIISSISMKNIFAKLFCWLARKTPGLQKFNARRNRHYRNHVRETPSSRAN